MDGIQTIDWTPRAPRVAMRPAPNSGRIPWGAVLGHAELPAAALAGAAEMAADHYRAAVAAEFSQTPVDTAVLPAWLPDRDSWWPRRALQQLGFARAPEARPAEELVLTAAVDPHVDGIHGPTLCLVLHNDGLTFQQGRRRNRAVAGDWFLFDDRRLHGVEPTDATTTFVGWVVPIARLPGRRRQGQLDL